MKIREIFNGKFLRISSFVAIVAVLGGFGLNALRMAMDSDAATKTFRSGIGHSFYGLTIPYINSPDGTMAYCLNFDLERPQGESYNSSSSMNNPNVKGILYYGYGGGDGGALQRKHGLSDHDARLATQVTIWKYGRNNPGVIPGNATIHNAIRFTGNASIDNYIEELYNKTYTGSTGSRLTVSPSTVGSTLSGEYFISAPISVTGGTGWTVKSISSPLGEVVNKTANSFSVRLPKYLANTTVTAVIEGGAGQDFTPLVWNTADSRVQDLISYNGLSTNGGGNTYTVQITTPGNTTNTPDSSTVQYRVKKTDPNGVAKSGAVFEIAEDAGFTIGVKRLTSGSDGYTPTQTYTFPAGRQLPVQTIYVKEVTAPTGMTRDTTTKTITLTQGQTSIGEVTYVNQYDTTTDSADTSLRIVKKDADGNYVGGVVFEYSFYEDFRTSHTATTSTTSFLALQEGVAIIGHTGYKKGEQVTYWVREKTVPSHLVLDQTKKKITVTAGGAVGELEFINQFKTAGATAKIIKKDAAGGLVQGVTFKISTDQNFTNAETLTTNAQGEISKVFNVRQNGTLPTVYVKEETVPSHLVKNTDVKSVRLQADTTVSVEFVNQFKDSTLRIIKKDETGALVPQVVFEYSDNQNFTNPQELTTGANGEITGVVAMAIREKTIYVREKTVPSHLVKSTEVKQVRLRAGETGSVEFINRFVRKNAIAKIVKKDADGRLVQGVVFEISTNQNFNNAETLTTNVQGEATKTYEIVGNNAAPTVYVREKTVPPYLIKNTEVKTVQLVVDQTKTFEFINQFEEGRLTIKKVDENGKAVKGVVFELSETQDFARAETVTTDDRGVAVKTYKTKQVAKTYYIREKSVPEHLVLSKEVKQLSLTPKGDATVTFTNEFKERDIKISKRDLSTAKPVPGATLTIYGADDKDNKNKVYENITNDSGDLPGLKLKPGKYKFIETHAPIGYKLNPNPHFFEVLEDGTILGSTVMDDERQDYEFEIDKVDQHGNRVVGAIFEAKNKIDGTILTATSDESGIAKFKGIWADYEITEKSAPNGYIKNDEIYVLQLKIDGTYERLKVVNNKVEAPNTGGLAGNILPILVSVGSILAVGTYLSTRKRA